MRMMPKTSCDSIGVTLACVGSGRRIVSLGPAAVTICCSFVPANCPRMACVTEVGGWTVREYINMELVVAMLAVGGLQPGILLLCLRDVNMNRCKHQDINLIER